MGIDELCVEVENALDEVAYLISNVIDPTWGDEKYHGFHNVLYGLIMRYFALVDVCSVYEHGGDNQTARMENFLHEKVGYELLTCRIAVKLWRHTLMHQASPSVIFDGSKNIEFYWLLHWDEEKLGSLKHMTFHDSGNRRILNVALERWLSDLRYTLTKLIPSLSKEQIRKAEEYFDLKNAISIKGS